MPAGGSHEIPYHANLKLSSAQIVGGALWVNPIRSFVTFLHASSFLLYLLIHYLAKMAAVYRVFNPIRSFVTSLHASSCLLYLRIHHLAKMVDTC